MSSAATQIGFDERYTLPLIEDVRDSAEETRRKQARVRQLCRERHAILLAHHYQRPEVQEVADAVADSLKLSQAAAKTNADVIVFCGVHFMAETAALQLPEKTVLLPDLRAGCSLAAAITADELIRWLRTARLMRLSLEVNGGICRSLLRVHRGIQVEDPEEVLT